MSLRRTLSRFTRSDRGAALVEFAIVLPILILLFVTVVETGRIMWSYQSAVAGVRDATRYIGRVVPTNACPPASNSAYVTDLTNIIRNRTDNGSTSALPPQVELDTQNANPVTVTFACVTGAAGSYRIASTPVATVTARVRITLPLHGLFRIAGRTIPLSIVTTISDKSRVFGS